MPTKEYLLRERERFRRTDPGMFRALTADLARLGHHDMPQPDQETAIPDDMERAVPRKAGRPKLPRCEHDRIIGRCVECEEED